MNVQASDKSTALLLAANKGNTELVKMLVSAKAEVNILGVNDMTPLMLAVRGEYVDCTKELIAAGAHVSYKDKDHKNTALMYSSLCSNVDLIDILISAGANVNDQNKNGLTFLMMAVGTRHVAGVRQLFNRGADVNIRSEEGITALSTATKIGNPDI